MKVIQSYIQHLQPDDFTIEIDYAYIIMLSSLLAKKHYGTPTLYTNEINFRFLSQMNFPFEYNIDIVNEYHSKLFSLSKFATMMEQTEPFIHLDLDTLIIKKPNLEVKKSPYIFSHPDVKFIHDKILEEENFTSKILSDDYFTLYDTYLRNYLRYYKELEGDEGKYDWPGKGFINLNDIPNMNFIGVMDDLGSFKDAIEKALVIVDNTGIIDNKEWSDAHFIEQFCLPLYLKKYNKQYNDLCESHQPDKFHFQTSQFLLDSNPILDIPYVKTVEMIENGNFDDLFQLVFELNQYCTECNQNHNINHRIESPEDLKDNLNLDFLKYYHIGGANKKIPLLQAMIIGHIVENFGEEYVLSVHNFFKNEIYKKQNIHNQISEGEYIYEYITDNKIFTKKSIII